MITCINISLEACSPNPSDALHVGSGGAAAVAAVLPLVGSPSPLGGVDCAERVGREVHGGRGPVLHLALPRVDRPPRCSLAKAPQAPPPSRAQPMAARAGGGT